MACKLIWAPSARLDLKEIASYIAESRPEASARFIKNKFHSVEHLIRILIRTCASVISTGGPQSGPKWRNLFN